MRSACDEILKFNAAFHHQPSLTAKLKALGSSPFGFFRGTFHLFARDLREGPFRKWPCLETAGQIVGDLHTENFGTFRAITNEIVYDINDFDETTQGPYEFDVRRLATSLVLSSLVNDRGLGLGAVVIALGDEPSAPPRRAENISRRGRAWPRSRRCTGLPGSSEQSRPERCRLAGRVCLAHPRPV